MSAGLFLGAIRRVAETALPDFTGLYVLKQEFTVPIFNSKEIFHRFCDRVTELLIEMHPGFPFGQHAARAWVGEVLESRFLCPDAYSYFATVFWDPFRGHEWLETIYGLSPDPIVQLFQDFSSHHPIIGPMAAWIYDTVQDSDSRFSRSFAWSTSSRSAKGWYLDIIDRVATIDSSIQHSMRGLVARTADKEVEGRVFLHGLLGQLNQFTCELVNIANAMIIRLSYSDNHELIYWPTFPRPQLGSWSETTGKLIQATPYVLPERVPEEFNVRAMQQRVVPLAVPINAVDLYHFVTYYEEYWRRLSKNLGARGSRQTGSPWSVVVCEGSDAGFKAYIKPDANSRGEARIALKYLGSGFEDFILRVDLARGTVATFDFAGISPERAYQYAALRGDHGRTFTSISDRPWTELSESDGTLKPYWRNHEVLPFDLTKGEKASLMATAIAHAGKHMATRRDFVSYHWDEMLGTLVPPKDFSAALKQVSMLLQRR